MNSEPSQSGGTNPSRLWHLGREYASQYQDQSVVDDYHLRPSYPAETFTVLADLCDPTCKRVLDVGCGTGEIARPISAFVDQVTAVDLSGPMLAKARRLPSGNAGNILWIEGEVETVPLAGPFGLITAASSLHWMSWPVVFSRFEQLLTPQGLVAIVFEHASGPSEPYCREIGDLIMESLTSREIPHREPFDLLDELASQEVICVAGQHFTEPIIQIQSIDDFIGSIHARTNFSRQRMGPDASEAFDRRAKEILSVGYPAGVLEMTVQMKIVWGRPSGG